MIRSEGALRFIRSPISNPSDTRHRRGGAAFEGPRDKAMGMTAMKILGSLSLEITFLLVARCLEIT